MSYLAIRAGPARREGIKLMLFVGLDSQAYSPKENKTARFVRGGTAIKTNMDDKGNGIAGN